MLRRAGRNEQNLGALEDEIGPLGRVQDVSETRANRWSMRSSSFGPRFSRKVPSRRSLSAVLVLFTSVYLLVVDGGYESFDDYTWNRFLWATSVRLARWLPVSAPKSSLAGSLSTRRQVLDMVNDKHWVASTYERERHLVESHLASLERDMTSSTINETLNTTLVLLWSGAYPMWNVQRPPMSRKVPNCNIPCEWTIDRESEAKRPHQPIAGVACMLYRMVDHNQCRDIDDRFLDGRPVLGITWENDWRNQGIDSIDEMPAQQLFRLQSQVPYNLISSYEIDSHIPILYKEMGAFVDAFEPLSLRDLLALHQTRSASIFFAISNCVAAIRPERLAVVGSLSRFLRVESFGRCLPNSANRAHKWNSRAKQGSINQITEMGKHLFAYTPENSYGLDYVTEKVWNALSAGSVPIYLGAPNIAAFLPDRNAVIHVSDYGSVDELGHYLQKLVTNRTMLVERHQLWRTRKLPEEFLRLTKLVDHHSDYNFACKVCNCFRGRIGCPLREATRY